LTTAAANEAVPIPTPAIEQALGLVGDRWSVLILLAACRGIHRFGQLQRGLGMARNVLADRLARLVSLGLLDRVRYRTDPDWYEYRPTASAVALYPLLAGVVDWAHSHLDGTGESPTAVRHGVCGKETHPEVRCSECGERLTTETIELT
jgi:DNA-binding HxlR family transcriptional regulator